MQINSAPNSASAADAATNLSLLFCSDKYDVSEGSIQFTLVVDDFGIKYIGKEHANHLIGILRRKYTAVATDWKGKLYCSITLKWNYRERYVDISMLEYIKQILAKFNHKKPTKPQYSPYPVQPRKYGRASQEPMPEDETPPASAEE